MSLDLREQISQLKKDEWVDLQALISCAITYIATSSELPNLSCNSISLLGQGSSNTVYKLEFSNNSLLVASVSNHTEEKFDPEAKRSEIEAMKFVRKSGLYPNVPVPEIFAWETNFTNSVCAPYVLMEYISGKALTNDLNTLPQAQQLAYIKSIAKLQASLSKPVPFDQIGSIRSGDDGDRHVVGPLMTMTQQCLGGPYKSIENLWRTQLEEQLLHVLQDWCSLETDLIVDDSCDTRCTPQMFSELFQLLVTIIPHFQPPKSYQSLVLHHPDIALRNILFDESSIASGDLKLTGLIGWNGAQILPLMFTAKYPADLRTTGEHPFKKPGWNLNESWDTVPCDWTSTGDPSQWPKADTVGDKPVDYGPSVHGAINKFYLRAYFNVCYAEQLCTLHRDADLSRATLFRDATYYMKFHEVVCGGWRIWADHKTWIKETYWRLRMSGHGGKDAEELIVGPNLYQDLVEEPVRDLSLSGEDYQTR